MSGRPTLSQYLFPQQVSCILNATDNELQPIRVDTQEDIWRASTLKLADDFARDLDQWTQSYHPSSIEVCYGCPQDVPIKPPTRVIVTGPDGGSVTCFFKPFRGSYRKSSTNIELTTHRKIARARIPSPPRVRICSIYGLVRDENVLLGMLFPWIDKRAVLSRGLAARSPASLRQRWASQIDASIKKLYQEGIIWGDAKAENVLIDKNDDAWIIDFGGSYTPGWVDMEKAGTLEGDMQGLGKIMDMLR
ncbi:Protein kinase-like domain [Coniochaeta hoffmannii]|uniref:Protein kinase-like domain n=1 Tax=Coniochaeta hoffmannii TaxID=91930 RepID=A0AA38VJ95_9PEZI|nr:Protein kinase-like domain [Coniochaeta hoffmannii]